VAHELVLSQAIMGRYESEGVGKLYAPGAANCSRL
jgi:hypothetical protein